MTCTFIGYCACIHISTAGLSAKLFAPTDRYRLFAILVYPELAAARLALAKCYCEDNGRIALEPVLMLGVGILQDLDGVPDRRAVEMLRYHAGWNFALNRQLGDPGFRSLRRAMGEFMVHYHEERNHQGLGNKIIRPEFAPFPSAGEIRCRERLGGMLRYYYRQAA